MLTPKRKIAIVISVIIIVIIIAFGLEEIHQSKAIHNNYTTSISTTTISTTSISTTTISTTSTKSFSDPVLTSAQAEILVGPNATYSLKILNTTPQISNYRLNFVSNVSSIWIMDYLNGPVIDPNWGIEQIVIEANTNKEALNIYSQRWSSILEPGPQQIPVNGTYNGMTYSYNFNKISYRLGFIGIMNNSVTAIVIGTDNTSINATQLIQFVADDLQR